MNAKQKKFCDEYLIDLNATKAAIRAGYSPQTAQEQGARLLSKAIIRAYIDGELEQMHSKRIAEATEIMEYLTSVMRGEQKETVLKLSGIGIQEPAELSVPARERLKAAELLGKRFGLFRENVDLNLLPVVITGAELLED